MINQPGQGSQTKSSFYWDHVIIEVERTLVRVPRQGLIEASPIFADLFTLPSPSGGRQEGDTDSEPIRLDGVKKVDFEALLKVVFPTSANITSGTFDLTKKEWLGAMKLAAMWEMGHIRLHAIQVLSASMTPAEKVTHGLEHGIGRWVRDGVKGLVEDSQISLEDLLSVGADAASRILWIRQKTSSLSGDGSSTRRWEFGLASLKCLHCDADFCPPTVGAHTLRFQCGACQFPQDYVDMKLLYTEKIKTIPGRENEFEVHPFDLRCSECARCPLPSLASIVDRCYSCPQKGKKCMIKLTMTRPSVDEMIMELFPTEVDE
ncbi:hypothetical protein DFP72DRAFT_636158 [Ephemerocybe angulata]|uniref:BTB domain-containing protein n=1 Tax=Ephemerocybe angulata TaxID=980116 RepID=A0A8H6HG91_9AGAR|nr:hypothetical protein DFP72DRAFT_636158 [Tulosesus angulatus]